MRAPASTPEGLTCDCGYSLRATSRDSRCPECGVRIRRLLAKQRLESWKQHRDTPPEIIEATAGLILGLFMLLLFFVMMWSHVTVEGMLFTGIGIGFCIVLSFSAIRRSTRNTIGTVLVRCFAPIAASVLWLLAALMIIFKV